MSRTLLTFWLFCSTITATSLVAAAAPDLIPVQGTVADADGAPINGETNMVFEIYDAPESGQLLYQSSYSSSTMKVNVDNGFFTVYLGELDAYPLDFGDLLTASQLWLQMDVNGETLDSRFRLASVPFAYQAKYCDQIGELEETDIQTAIGDACEEGEFLRGWDDSSGEPICGADMVGENSSAVSNWDDMINIPGGFADNTDDGFASEEELTSLLDDNYIGRSQADSITSGMITDGTIGAADVNSAAIQLRGSTTSCDPGQYVSGIGANGNVTCRDDQNAQASYSAGTGLDLSGVTLSVDTTDFSSVPQQSRSSSSVALGTGDWSVLRSATIDLKTPGWVVAIGVADMRVSVLSGTFLSQVGISTSDTGGCIAESVTELRPDIQASENAAYQQTTQAIIYFDTAGSHTVYMKGYSSTNDTILAYRPNLILFSIPADQTN